MAFIFSQICLKSHSGDFDLNNVLSSGRIGKICTLTFSTFCANSTDEKLAIFSLKIGFEILYKLPGPASVAQLDAPSDWRPGGCGFNPHRGQQHSFVEIDHEIFSTVILSLPLIQEGQLSVSGERMCTILVNRLED